METTNKDSFLFLLPKILDNNVASFEAFKENLYSRCFSRGLLGLIAPHEVYRDALRLNSGNEQLVVEPWVCMEHPGEFVQGAEGTRSHRYMVYTAALKDYVTQNTAIRELTNHVRDSLTTVQQRAIAPGLMGTLGMPLPTILNRLGKIYGVLSSAALSTLMTTLQEAYVEGTDIRVHTFRHQEVHRIYLATTTQALAEQQKIASFLGTLPPRFAIVEDNYVIAEPVLSKRTFNEYAKNLHMWSDNHPMPTAASNGYAASSIAISTSSGTATDKIQALQLTSYFSKWCCWPQL